MPYALALLLAFASAFQAPSTTLASPSTEAGGSLGRVIVLGSSVSDGFGLQQKGEAGVRTTLADVGEAALIAEHAPVHGHTSQRMHINTAASGRQLVENARDRNPTLVVAVDFLFWYGYGALGSESARLALLEKGLAQLEGFHCPVLVGDFPDLGAALQGQSPLLHASRCRRRRRARS
jgi:hypothetical protein